MASGILSAVNDIISAGGAIAFDWGNLSIAHSRPDKLFQLVTLWNDQVARSANGSGYAFETPALFLEIKDLGTDMLGDGVSMSEPIWRFHIVDEEIDAGDGTMDKNLTVYTYRDKLKQAMAGFQPSNCSTLFAVNEEPDYNHAGFYHYILDLKSCFIDTKGTDTDPDQDRVIYSTPPTALELDAIFEDREVPIDPISVYTWKVCAIRVKVVAVPDGSMQTLDNGAVIPVQYALNNDGTLTIPYLLINPSVAILTPFIIDNGVIQDEPYDPATATFDNGIYGGFVIGNNISFNASLPIGV